MDLNQYDLWPETEQEVVCIEQSKAIDDIDVLGYDRYVVFFSGGKDSLACVLHLLEEGVAPENIELHHHLIDGREGSTLMDWPVTEAYCEAVAKYLGMKYGVSWREGGFEREMLRNQTPTGAVLISDGMGGFTTRGGDGPVGKREKFPQVSADLSVRWCSSYLKIDVGSTYLRHGPEFRQGKTLVVTGERAEESVARSKYKVFEPDRADLRNGRQHKRYIDHWRPIHQWKEAAVWDIIRRHAILPHPAYYLGWGRVSCRQCIFGSKNQWATVKVVAPGAFEAVAAYEERFGVTIQRKESVRQLAERGTPYQLDQKWVEAANAHTMTMPIYVGDQWILPSGAYGESCGPT